MMKNQFRTLGIDDAPFKFMEKNVLVVGALMRGRDYLEAVMKTHVKIDGRDANRRLSTMINKSRYREQIKAVFLDGVALGGFNVIDIEKLYKEVKIPIITITRKKPIFDEIHAALKKHFDDWEERWNVIRKEKIAEIKTKHKPVYITHIGIELDEVKKIMERTTVRGVLPEPVRVAHLIASAIAVGESYGKA